MIFTGLLVGIAFGAVLQWGRFCVTGMLRDIFLSKTWRTFTALMILISVHAFGLTLLTQLGVIAPEISNFSPVAVIVGGLIFGLGIVLSGGCASGTWYRSAEGLVGSWIALLFYGISAAAMKSGPLKPGNEWFKQWELPLTTIHGALGISPWILVAVTWAITLALWWRYRGKGNRFYPAAIIIGVIATVAFPLSAATGRNGGLGITTPTADLIRWSATGDAERMNWGTLLVIGLFIGAFVAAKAAGEFRVRVPDATTACRAIAGGVMMGVGASLAGGCTVGNGMVETSLFSFQGWVSLLFMALGVGLGAKLWIKPKPIKSAVGMVGLKTQPEAPQKARSLGDGRYALDTLGAVCPFPLVEAKQAMNQLQKGEALVIDFDCTQATDSIPAWAESDGHEVADFRRSGDAGWQVTVVKG